MSIQGDKQENKDALRDAVLEGKALLARSLMNDNPKLLLRKDQDGRTPLHWAVSLGDTELVSEMLKAAKSLKGFDIDMEDDSGWTLAHIASSTGNLAVLELLSPFDPDWNAQTSAGQAPIHFAASKVHPEIVRYLLSHGASARSKDSLNRTALHRAASAGSVPIIKMLVAAKCPINSTDASSWTALHHAMIEGHGDSALELIRSGADVERRDSEGKTPLELAHDEQVLKFVKTNMERE